MGRKSIKLDTDECKHIQDTYGYDAETGVVYFLPTVKVILKAGKATGQTIEKGGAGYRVMFVTFPNGKRRGIKVHLAAWLIHHGVWPEHFIDHKSGDKTDNRLVNLQLATDGQNRANIPKYKTYAGKATTSIYKGVSLTSNKKKWVVNIRVDKVLISLGTFPLDREIDAAKAYNNAAVLHFRDRARLNIIPDAVTPQPSGARRRPSLSDDE